MQRQPQLYRKPSVLHQRVSFENADQCTSRSEPTESNRRSSPDVLLSQASGSSFEEDRASFETVLRRVGDTKPKHGDDPRFHKKRCPCLPVLTSKPPIPPKPPRIAKPPPQPLNGHRQRGDISPRAAMVPVAFEAARVARMRTPATALAAGESTAGSSMSRLPVHIARHRATSAGGDTSTGDTSSHATVISPDSRRARTFHQITSAKPSQRSRSVPIQCTRLGRNFTPNEIWMPEAVMAERGTLAQEQKQFCDIGINTRMDFNPITAQLITGVTTKTTKRKTREDRVTEQMKEKFEKFQSCSAKTNGADYIYRELGDQLKTLNRNQAAVHRKIHPTHSSLTNSSEECRFTSTMKRNCYCKHCNKRHNRRFLSKNMKSKFATAFSIANGHRQSISQCSFFTEKPTFKQLELDRYRDEFQNFVMLWLFYAVCSFFGLLLLACVAWIISNPIMWDWFSHLDLTRFWIKTLPPQPSPQVHEGKRQQHIIFRIAQYMGGTLIYTVNSFAKTTYAILAYPRSAFHGTSEVA